MRTIRHRSLMPAALRSWIARGVGTTVTYHLVTAASGSGVNWSAGTASATDTAVPDMAGLWIDGVMEAEGVQGGGTVRTDAMLATAGPPTGTPSTRDYLVRNGLRYEVADAVQPPGMGGTWLLALKRTR